MEPPLATYWSSRCRSFDNYGQKSGGPCPVQLFPSRYPIRAAMIALDRWVKDRVRPTTAPRFERDPVRGAPVVDPETGNIRGGLRLPPIAAPVATYTSECALFGSTIPYDKAKLAGLYPTHEDYVRKFAAAADEAVTKGWLRRPDAAELVRAAEASDIGRTPVPTF